MAVERFRKPWNYRFIFCFLVATTTPSYSIDFSCRGLFHSLRNLLISAEHPVTRFHEGSSLMVGTPPGISLDGKDIFALHLAELFDSDSGDWFAWMRLLSQPLRRRLGHVNELVKIKKHLNGKLWTRSLETDTSDKLGSNQLAQSPYIAVSDSQGHAVFFGYHEYPLEGDIDYFIITGISLGVNYFDHGYGGDNDGGDYDDDKDDEPKAPPAPTVPQFEFSPR